VDKTDQKFPPRARWWINQANARYAAGQTYCRPRWGGVYRGGLLDWLRFRHRRMRSFIKHQTLCRLFLPKHKCGEYIDTTTLPNFSPEGLVR